MGASWSIIWSGICTGFDPFIRQIISADKTELADNRKSIVNIEAYIHWKQTHAEDWVLKSKIGLDGDLSERRDQMKLPASPLAQRSSSSNSKLTGSRMVVLLKMIPGHEMFQSW
jgi:hypothetical protein